METTVSAEQRVKQLADRKAMLEAAESLSEDERKKLVADLSVRDRLMRIIPASRVKTTIKDDLGDFTIVTRALTSMEGDVATEITQRLAQSKGEVKVARDIFNEMRDFLSNVTVTKEIDWHEPLIPDHVVTLVFLNTLTSTSASAKEGLASFRPV